jgi:hypothetical protein
MSIFNKKKYESLKSLTLTEQLLIYPLCPFFSLKEFAIFATMPLLAPLLLQLASIAAVSCSILFAFKIFYDLANKEPETALSSSIASLALLAASVACVAIALISPVITIAILISKVLMNGKAFLFDEEDCHEDEPRIDFI